MKYTIARYSLFLLLIPLLLFGCDRIGPEDKWPVVANVTVNANPNVTLEFIEGIGAPRLTVGNRNVEVQLDVRSFNAGQEWKVTTFLERVDRYWTTYDDNLPEASFSQKIAILESFYTDHIVGSYQGGLPPQGTVRLTVHLALGWFPECIDDWISYSIIEDKFVIHWLTDRYVYYFRTVVEDLEGRSDTFTFELYSILIVED